MHQRIVVMRWIAECHAPPGVCVLSQAVPHGRLGIGVAFRIAMNTQEVHPHFGELREHGLVIIGAPGIEAKRVRAPRVDPAQGEERLPGFIQYRQLELHLRIRHHIAVQVEAHAEFFYQSVRAVEHAGIAAAGNGQGGAITLQPVLLGRKLRVHTQADAGSGRGERQQLIGPQIHISPDLLGGELDVRGGIRRTDNDRFANRGAGHGECEDCDKRLHPPSY